MKILRRDFVSNARYVISVAKRLAGALLSLDRDRLGFVCAASALTSEERAAWKSILLGPFLNRSGWFRSKLAALPVDAEGNSLPWLSYAAIYLIERKLPPGLSVLEFGAGNSTLWWSKRVRRMVSVENNSEWYDRIARSVPASVDLRYVPLDKQRVVLDGLAEEGCRFDIVVIDGGDRAMIAAMVDKLIHGGSVIIFDDSERSGERLCVDALVASGYKELELHSLAPIVNYSKSTSILYRTGNVLNL